MTGDQLKRLRKRLGETQEEFAARFGVTRTALIHWENKKIPENGTGARHIARVVAEIRRELSHA